MIGKKGYSMRMSRFIALSLMVALLSFVVAPAFATTYEKPALNNIIKSMIRFGAMDIYDDEVIDVYARTNECKIFNEYYKDVFKWEEIRQKLRESVRTNVATYPTGYRYDTTLKLDRYDFKRQMFPFDLPAVQKKVNVFIMQAHQEDYCNDKDLRGFPTAFRLVLGSPVSLEGLELNEEQGKALFTRMNENKNFSHLVYVSFNIRVQFVASLDNTENKKKSREQSENALAKVQQKIQSDMITLDSRLDSIDFYEDAERTRLIYTQRF